MNWYKICQQSSFPFMDNPAPGYLSSTPEWDAWSDERSCDDMRERIEECSNEQEFFDLLNRCNIDYDKIETPIGKTIYSVILDGNVYIIENLDIQEAEEWIRNVSWSGRITDYITARDFNEEFWNNPGVVYHGTNEERVEDILSNGLESRDETRGINNRSTGSAVFTSTDAAQAEYYYDVVFEINLGQMAADGYKPSVSLEGPIEDAEAEEALAHKIGLEDYYVEVEQGLDPGTVVIYGSIPPKYISVLGEK